MPFTADQFFDIFAAYNLALQNIRWVFWIFTAAAVGLVLWPTSGLGRVITVILALMWLWTGVVYHIYFFSTINPAAFLFGAMCIAQAAIFLYSLRSVRYRITRSAASIVGILLLIYGLLIYPLLGEYLGHIYPRRPTFGTPCPTTVFTFGILLFLETRPSLHIYAIPFIWSLIGTTAAYLFGVYEDLGLLVAGVVGSSLLYLKK